MCKESPPLSGVLLCCWRTFLPVLLKSYGSSSSKCRKFLFFSPTIWLKWLWKAGGTHRAPAPALPLPVGNSPWDGAHSFHLFCHCIRSPVPATFVVRACFQSKHLKWLLGFVSITSLLLDSWPLHLPGSSAFRTPGKLKKAETQTFCSARPGKEWANGLS